MIQFIKRLFFLTLTMSVVGLFPFISWASSYWLELLFSFSISIINALVGYYLVLLSIDKPNNDFYKIVYGGMLLRMIFVASFAIFIISNKVVSMVPFMLLLMIFYTAHQWVEITGWIKVLPTRKVQL